MKELSEYDKKYEQLKQVMADLFCEHGSCYFDVAHIAKTSNVAAEELTDEDRGGILDALCDDGFLVEAGYPACYCISSDAVQFDL